MPRIGPISRRDLIRYLRNYGFDGPYSGGKHQFMIYESITLHVPNPHHSDISVDLLKKILRQAHISNHEWVKL